MENHMLYGEALEPDNKKECKICDGEFYTGEMYLNNVCERCYYLEQLMDFYPATELTHLHLQTQSDSELREQFEIHILGINKY